MAASRAPGSIWLQQSIGETETRLASPSMTAVPRTHFTLGQQKQGSFISFPPKGRLLIEGLGEQMGKSSGTLIATVKGGKTVARSIVIVESNIGVS